MVAAEHRQHEVLEMEELCHVVGVVRDRGRIVAFDAIANTECSSGLLQLLGARLLARRLVLRRRVAHVERLLLPELARAPRECQACLTDVVLALAHALVLATADGDHLRALAVALVALCQRVPEAWRRRLAAFHSPHHRLHESTQAALKPARR